MPLTPIPIMTEKGVSVPIAHHLLKGPSISRTPFSSTPTLHSTLRNKPPGHKTLATSFKSVELPRRLNSLNTMTTLSYEPSTSSPPPPLALPTTRLPKYKRTSMTPRGLVQTLPGAGTGDSWLTAWELTATGGVMLRTRLLPVQAQDNEELVRLQVDADTGNLRLLDMLLNLDLFLSLAVDRWTACVTH